MNKKSIWGCWLLLVSTFAISCADLRDADECYRYARLACEKSCTSTDKNACIELNKSICHSSIKYDSNNESVFTDCADKLANLDDCAGQAQAEMACGAMPTSKCTFDYDCPSGYTCLGGTCVQQSSNSGACNSSADCPGSKYCASDGGCYDSCNSNSDCFNAQSCTYDSRAGQSLCLPDKASITNGNGGLASSCQSTSDCDSSYNLACIDGRCTKSCATTSNCTAADSNALCAGTGTNTYCTLPCSSSSTCAGSQTCTTQDIPASGGTTRQVCTPSSGGHTGTTQDTGGPCSSSSDCSGSLSCLQGMCTETCNSDGDCSASTYTGRSPVCVTVVPGSTRYCFAGCSPGGSDCPSGDSCAQMQNSTGGSSYVCRPNTAGTITKGAAGDACTSVSECNQTINLVCINNMCTKPCNSPVDCGPASNPESSECSNNICTRTCSNNACPPGWSCNLDPNSDNQICMRQ